MRCRLRDFPGRGERERGQRHVLLEAGGQSGKKFARLARFGLHILRECPDRRAEDFMPDAERAEDALEHADELFHVFVPLKILGELFHVFAPVKS